MLRVKLWHDSGILSAQPARQIVLILDASAIGTHTEQMLLFIRFKISNKMILLRYKKKKK